MIHKASIQLVTKDEVPSGILVKVANSINKEQKKSVFHATPLIALTDKSGNVKDRFLTEHN